jgi:hypothetical protein
VLCVKGFDVPGLGVQGACLCVIGALGESLGFLLFPSLAGFEAFAERAGAQAPGERLDLGTTFLSLNFERGADLPPAMRREVAEHGWPVAGPHAYPRIDQCERDGSRRPVTEREVRLVSAVATSLASFFVKHANLDSAEKEPICETWTDQDDLAVRLTAPYEAAPLFAENRPERAPEKIGRNAPCPCGSGKKYKRCCLQEAAEAATAPAKAHALDENVVAQMRKYASRRFGEAWHLRSSMGTHRCIDSGPMPSAAPETAYFLNRQLPHLALIGKGVRFPQGQWVRVAAGDVLPWQVDTLVAGMWPDLGRAAYSMLLTEFDVDEFELAMRRAG